MLDHQGMPVAAAGRRNDDRLRAKLLWIDQIEEVLEKARVGALVSRGTDNQHIGPYDLVDDTPGLIIEVLAPQGVAQRRTDIVQIIGLLEKPYLTLARSATCRTSASVFDGRLKLPAMPTSLKPDMAFPLCGWSNIVYKITGLKECASLLRRSIEKTFAHGLPTICSGRRRRLGA
ncbi:hypothetical protein ABID08_002763 [Rhizobium binae]|uniref:Restriction endonuclease domain-containing protein n=1 Tax=Rhizobium binae TaxID=1138190 RepID=A0ABV2MFZ7_9HYPH